MADRRTACELASGSCSTYRSSVIIYLDGPACGVENPAYLFSRSFEPGTATFGLDAVVNEIGRQLLSADQFDLWVPETVSPYVTWAYWWLWPPSRSNLDTC